MFLFLVEKSPYRYVWAESVIFGQQPNRDIRMQHPHEIRIVILPFSKELLNQRSFSSEAQLFVDMNRRGVFNVNIQV